ncbi:MAG: AAA+ family ATPase, partial [Cyanobacteriota bacterium]|nr:AAA+ family ATPase [Cyanobacteriota bacterium]
MSRNSSLNPQLIAQVHFLQRQAASLLLYQSVLTDATGQAFIGLLATLEKETNALDCLQAYGRFFQEQAAHQ